MWKYIKKRMLRHPQQHMCESAVEFTFEKVVVLTESFAKTLTASCYAILCQSELASALALLSCMAAGVTAVPMSYRYGEAHCAKILQKIHPQYIITDIGGELRVIDVDTGEYDSGCAQPPSLIMCTSGTTGVPKGAMLTSENILTNLCDIESYFKLNAQDNILITRPLYHCAVLTGEFLLALAKGANIRFYSDKFNPAEAVYLIEKYKITTMCGTPTMFRFIGRFAKGRLSEGLNNIVLSGEPMDKHTADGIRKAFPNANIYHVYGLTEASPRVAYLAPRYFNYYPESVGIPLKSVELKIVDRDGKELPYNNEGELLVRGKSVMMGYYGDSDLTQCVLEDGWLHTGDIAYLDERDMLHIRCRKDDMIIRAGMNIYPQEIEAALREDKRVEEVLAYGISDVYGGELIGLLVKGDFDSVQEIVALCKSELPSYARPNKIEIVSEIPKNGSGKVIRGKKHV